MSEIKVALIDDDPRTRRRITRYLRRAAGFEVRAFGSGQRAVDELSQHWQTYTVAVVDLVLQDISGFAVVEALTAQCPELPIIIMTGVSQQDGSRAVTEGAYAYFRKPVDPIQLVNAVRDLHAQKDIVGRLVKDMREMLKPDVVLARRLIRPQQTYDVVALSGDVSAEFQAQPGIAVASHSWLDTLIDRQVQFLHAIQALPTGTHPLQTAIIAEGWQQGLVIALVERDILLGLIECFWFKETPLLAEETLLKPILVSYAARAAESLRQTTLALGNQALQEVNQTISITHDEAEILQQILSKATEVTEVENGWIYLPDRLSQKLTVKSTWNVDADVLRMMNPAADGVARKAVKQGVAQRVTIKGHDALHPAIPIRSKLAIPLRHNWHTLGVLAVVSPHPNYFTDDDVDLLTSLASMATITINRSRLARYLSQLGDPDLHKNSVEEVQKTIVELTAELLGADVSLWRFSTHDEEGDSFLRIAASSQGVPAEYVKNAVLSAKADGSLCGIVLAEGEKIYNDIWNKNTTPLMVKYPEYALAAGWKSLLMVPLVGDDDEPLGVVSVYGTNKGQFTQADADFLRTFTNQAATTLQRYRWSSMIDRLAEVSRRLTDGVILNPYTILQEVVEEVCNIVGADCAVLYPYDQERDHFYDVDRIASHGINEQGGGKAILEKPRTQGLTAAVRLHGVLVVNNVVQGELSKGFAQESLSEDEKRRIIERLRHSNFLQRENIGAFIGISLRNDYNKKVINPVSQEVGVLYISFRRPHRFSAAELQIIRIYAQQVAGVIFGARAFRRTQRSEQELTAVQEIAVRLSTTTDFQQLFEVLILNAAKLVGGTGGKVYRDNPEENSLKLLAIKGTNLPVAHNNLHLQYGQGLAGRVFLTGKPRIIKDYPNWRGSVADLRPFFKEIVCVPLLKEGKPIGVLSITGNSPFREAHIPVLERLAQQAALIIAGKQQTEELHRKSQQLQSLHLSTLNVLEQRDPDKIIDLFIQQTINLTQERADHNIVAAWWDIDVAQNQARLRAGLEEAYRGESIPLDQGVISEVMQYGTVQYRNDYQVWHKQLGKVESWGYMIQNAIAVPVRDVETNIVSIIGVADLGGNRRFTGEDKLFFGRLGDLASLITQSAEIAASNRATRDQLKTVSQIMIVISRDMKWEDIMDRVKEEWRRVIPFDRLSVHLLDGDKPRQLSARFGYDEHEIDKELLNRLIDEDSLITSIKEQEDNILILPTAQAHPNWDIREKTQRIQSWVGILLQYDDEPPFGLITLDSYAPAAFDDSYRYVLGILARQLTIAYKKSRLHEQQRQRINGLNIINALAEKFGTILDHDQLFEMVAQEFRNILLCDHCTIFQPQEQDGRLLFKPTHTSGKRVINRSFNQDEGLVGYVYRTGEVLCLGDARDHPNFAPATVPSNYRSMLLVPVREVEAAEHQAGRIVAIICLDTTESDFFHSDEANLLRSIARFVGIAYRNAQLRLEHIEVERMRQSMREREEALELEQLITIKQGSIGIAHRMNNMAGVIPPLVDLVKNQLYEEPEKIEESIEILDQITARSKEMMRKAAELKIAGQQTAITMGNELDKEPLNLNEAVEQALQEIERTIYKETKRTLRHWQFKLVRELTPGLGLVYGSSADLAFVLSNLIRNAIDAVDAVGGHHGEVVIRTLNCKLNGKLGVRFEVEDNGRGIATHHLPRLYELAFTTKESGVGYGLWATNIIVKIMGGRLDVETAEDEGTTFTLCLPSLSPDKE